jgi:hypothetical protein
MSKVLTLALFLCLSINLIAVDERVSPLQESAKIESDILNGKLSMRTEKALNFVIITAAAELRKKGHKSEADRMEQEWNGFYRNQFRQYAMGMEMKDIGDHAPLSQWLAEKYELLEAVLGVEVCKKTHLSDLKTLNFTIPVVFRPCTFPMDGLTLARVDEYRNHFSEGQHYYGLAPVTAYWIVYASVAGATMGTGFVFIAGIAGDIAEKLFALITPKLSDTIYKKACS